MALDFINDEMKVYTGKGCVTLTRGKKYLATYWNGKLLAFQFDGNLRYDRSLVCCSKAEVSRNNGETWEMVGARWGVALGYCTETTGDWKDVKELEA